MESTAHTLLPTKNNFYGLLIKPTETKTKQNLWVFLSKRNRYIYLHEKGRINQTFFFGLFIYCFLNIQEILLNFLFLGFHLCIGGKRCCFFIYCYEDLCKTCCGTTAVGHFLTQESWMEKFFLWLPPLFSPSTDRKLFSIRLSAHFYGQLHCINRAIFYDLVPKGPFLSRIFHVHNF